jgi:dCMP deaminase
MTTVPFSVLAQSGEDDPEEEEEGGDSRDYGGVTAPPCWQPRPPTPGRQVPSWDEYFLAMAKAASLRSRDPHTQCGCVIADARTHHLVATGCNGPPPGIIGDDELDWSRPQKYDLVIHGEANAILHATRADLSGCHLYVTGHPCSQCMRMIAAKRIKRVVYSPLEIKMMDEQEREKSQRIARLCWIDVFEYDEQSKTRRQVIPDPARVIIKD